MSERKISKSNYCAAFGCTNAKYNPNCREKSFFRFPWKDNELMKTWLVKLKREGFSPSPWSILCSDHFEEKDFTYENFTNRRLLKKGAVPSIFIFSKPPKTRRVLQRIPLQENEDPSTTECHSENKCEASTQTSSFSEIIDELSLVKQELSNVTEVLQEKDFRSMNIKTDQQMKAITGFTKEMFFSIYGFLNIENDLLEKTSLPPIEQFFLFLVKLRTGVTNEFLSILFNVSNSTISRYFVHTVRVLNEKFKLLDIWPTKQQVQEYMPVQVSKDNRNCRIIIDCTEFNIQKPSNPREQQITFSTYKNNNTLKGMIGIMPSGAITFISDLYCGSISDKELFLQSGIMRKLEIGDMVMADKGFRIEKELSQIKCFLKTPSFLKDKIQFPFSERETNTIISNTRVHVERAISRKNISNILKETYPIQLYITLMRYFLLHAIWLTSINR